MVSMRAHDSDEMGRTRRRLTKVASLGLGLAMFGTIGLSGTLAQDDGVVAGGDTEALVNSIIQQVFAEIFGGGVVAEDDSSGGDINVGGNMGGSVTMGGGSGGSINMGSSGGGVMMGDDSGG
jgi:hypothetical protein